MTSALQQRQYSEAGARAAAEATANHFIAHRVSQKTDADRQSLQELIFQVLMHPDSVLHAHAGMGAGTVGATVEGKTPQDESVSFQVFGFQQEHFPNGVLPAEGKDPTLAALYV